jgi:hypothetical protein
MSATDAPGRTASATIRRFSSSDHERRDRFPQSRSMSRSSFQEIDPITLVPMPVEIAIRSDNVYLADYGH